METSEIRSLLLLDGKVMVPVWYMLIQGHDDEVVILHVYRLFVVCKNVKNRRQMKS